MKNTNIVGEPFAKYVNDQIEQRQLVYGDGLNSTRDPKHIQYLNSRTSWIKMASSVIVNPDPASEVDIAQIITTGEDGTFRLKNLGIDVEQFKGYKLASNFILFNGVQQGNFRGVADARENKDNKKIDPTTTGKFLSYTKRAGIATSNSNWNNAAYGLGGTDFGLQPMPGINSLEIKHLNRGSIRKATITLKAYNKFQFEVINTLYLRLGFNMLLEWGNSHYIESSGLNPDNTALGAGNIDYVRNTLTEDVWFNAKYSTSSNTDLLNQIEKYREKYDGNYDGFMGRVTNFSWDYNPDGSYNIIIDLASLGDVIESLKVNVSRNYKVTKEGDENIDDITSFLNDLSKQPEVFNRNPNNSNYLDINSLTGNTSFAEFFVGGKTKEFPEVSEELRHYIRFGSLLEYLENSILIHFSNGGEDTFPIVNIDYNSEVNVMPIYPNQISFNPKVCLVRTNYFSPPLQSKGFFFYGPMASFSAEGDIPYGKIMNIYLNFKTIKDKLKSNVDNKGNLSLFNFIKSLCDEINKSLGGINNLEPIVVEDKNTLVILDQNNYPDRENIRKEILEKENLPKEEETSFPIDLFGYNRDKNSSNFVKNFSLKTEIDPSLATTITIGATSEGQVVGEDATAFSQWNRGLTDRYKQFQAPPIPSAPSSSLSDESDSAFLTSAGLYGSGYSPYKHNKNALESRNDLMRKNIQTYLLFTFGKGYNSSSFTSNKETLYTQFERNNYSNWVNIGVQSFKNSISNLYNEKGVITSTLGFIPLKLQLTLDGLSGIKIYQKLRVNTDFLPSNYPEILEFLVTKVDHSLSDNEWTTKIETISIPVVKEIPITTELSDINLSPVPFREAAITSELTFTLPVQGILDSPPKVRVDTPGGSGFYGANREPLKKGESARKHTGVDFSTTIGQPIFAPIPGNVQYTKAGPNRTLDGIKIFGRGEFEGITVYMLYSQLSIPVGTIVSQGEQIGNALDLSKDYSEEVSDHIHFKIEFNGVPVNPENVFYKYNGKDLQGDLLFGRNSTFTRLTAFPNIN